MRLLARLAALLVFLVAVEAGAMENRYYLVNQQDFGAKQGYCLDFENSGPDNGICQLDSLRLILGAADGKSWRFSTRSGGWQLGRRYVVRAVITPTSGRLYLDGTEVGSIDGGFIPSTNQMTYAEIPGWASGPAEYLIRQESLRITAGGRSLASASIPPPTAPLPLQLFAPPAASSAVVRVRAGETVVIEAAVTISRYPSITGMAPFIDRYGQSVHSRWPGKVKSDADLLAANRDEARRSRGLTPPAGRDRFGGATNLGWHEHATGYFRVAKRKGIWWLVTPLGNPCFYIGVDSIAGLQWERTPVTDREFLFQWIPPKRGATAAAWNRNDWGGTDGTETVAFQSTNMLRKYGPNWMRIAKQAASRRLRQWGFSGGGKWGNVADLPFTPVLGHYEVPNIARHPDIYDGAIQQKFRDELKKQMGKDIRNPLVLGWSVGNEYDEIITPEEVTTILSKPAGTPAKDALCRTALEDLYDNSAERLSQAWGISVTGIEDLCAATAVPPAADVEKLRLSYARDYYSFIYRTVKDLDPNHLYLGFWIVPGWWVNEADWTVSAPFCDVIGYDRYANDFEDPALAALVKASAKPILCGEYSFPPTYRGERGFGFYGTNVPDEKTAVAMYTRWLGAALREPYCVGSVWFQYRDQPLSGRGPGRGKALVHGEHYAFGVVDLCDRPKWELVTGMRKANQAALKLRLGARR